MKQTIFVTAAFIFSVAAHGLSNEASDAPKIPIRQCRNPPVLDGILDDACWREAYQSTQFYKFELKKRGFEPNNDTKLYLTTDGIWLYFGLDCKHPTPDDMQVAVKENFGGRVFGDECIKFFINPGLPGETAYRYVLNCANVCDLTRNFSVEAPALAWPSATSITKDGWSAEVAVPLFDFVGYGELNDIRFNVFRKKIVKEYDAYDVNVGCKESISTLVPTAAWMVSAEMARFDGLDKLKLRVPFLANALQPEIGKIYEDKGQMRYDVNLTLAAMTAQAGTARVEVVERTLAGTSGTHALTFPLAGNAVIQARVPVTISALGARELDVVIRNERNGMPFQTMQIRDTSEFDLLSGMFRYNYYTGESNAEIIYTAGMSRTALEKYRLAILDAGGKELARLDAPLPQGTMNLPLEGIRDGTHALNLILQDSAGRKLFELPLSLLKLPPKPGCEWKVDRAVGGTLLHDGQPFFPFGTLVALDEEQFKEAAEAGMNSVVWWFGGYDNSLDSFLEIMRLGEKYGLKVIVNFMAKSRADEMATLRKFFPDEKKRKQAVAGLDSLIRIKMYDAQFHGLSRAQRNEISMEWMDLHLPDFMEMVRTIRNFPSLLGYDTLDEPSFRYADLCVPLQNLYLELKKEDPYHPMFGLYSSTIPPESCATSFFDCLGTDPYWTPGRTLPRGSINWMSTTTAKTVARAAKDGLSPWTVPQASLWSDVVKRMITPEEQICQTYLALIHGTRAIWYFTHGWFTHKDQWAAVETLSKQIKTLTPALTALRPAQEITYTPGNWAPLKGDVPHVQANLLRDPDGRCVLLAANVLRSAAEITVTADGLLDGGLNDLFKGRVGEVKDGVFTDKLAARGVRAYDFGKLTTDRPVKIAIQITPLGEDGLVESGYREEGRTGMKNIQPNPSFEEATHPGWPDYFWPYSRGGVWGARQKRIGMPDAGFGLTTENPFHGKYCVFLTPDFSLFWRLAPQFSSEQPFVLSFYARTDSDAPAVIRLKPVGGGWIIPQSDHFITITGKEWKRYVVRMKAVAGMSSHTMLLLQGREMSGKVWIDAIQIENGMDPTEFQP